MELEAALGHELALLLFEGREKIGRRRAHVAAPGRGLANVAGVTSRIRANILGIVKAPQLDRKVSSSKLSSYQLLSAL